MMELTIIGCGTAALEFGRGPSGYVLKVEDETFLLDGGTGTLLKCLQTNVSYRNIDKIFYTHLHPDHTIDLVPFLFATKNTPGFIRSKPLEIFGPVGFRQFFDSFVDLFGRSMLDISYALEIHELAETELQRPSFALRSDLMKHSENAIGFRFNAHGRTFVYSGDTDMCEGIEKLAYKADLLLIECSFPDSDKVAGHLTPSEVGRIAAAADVQRLILTHIYPPFDEMEILASVQRFYNGEAMVAREFMKVEI